jgi:hypothetical protein
MADAPHCHSTAAIAGDQHAPDRLRSAPIEGGSSQERSIGDPASLRHTWQAKRLRSATRPFRRERVCRLIGQLPLLLHRRRPLSPRPHRNRSRRSQKECGPTVQCREAAGRQASPTAGVIDSQRVKSTDKGGARSIRPVMTRARRSWERSAHLGQYVRIAAARHHTSGGCPRPRLRRAAAFRDASVFAQAVCRCRLPGTEVRRRCGEALAAARCGDRQTI